jgi:hypothetical protein
MGIFQQHEPNETAVLQLKDGNDETILDDQGEPFTATVYGSGTKQHLAAVAMINNQNVEKFRRKGKVNMTGEQLRQDAIAYATAITKEVSPNFSAEFPGVTGDDLVAKVYSTGKLGYLFAEQAAAFQKESANFTKG